jgi:hypothetical protein
MPANTSTPEGRPLRVRLLFAAAALVSLLGGTVFLLTALGFGHADVRGLRLTGALRMMFLVGLGLAVAGTCAATVGLYRQRRWAAPLLAAVWPAFALVCLTLDRITPAPGPGRPLAFYLLGIGLAPAIVTLLFGWRPASRSDQSVDRV